MNMAKKNIDLLGSFTKESALQAYYQMLRVRKFEEKCGQVYGMGQIYGFCHLCIGQEAIPVGISQVLKKGDQMITSYRCHGLNMVAGTEPKYILAELMAKSTGISKGKGGSMHLFDIEKGFFGGHGIVGAQVPLGTGLAFANKYRGNDNVCIVLMGDGAANQGQVYEAFNMAKLWNLPVLYIIENNKYAMGTSTARHSAGKSFYNRGEPYGIPGIIVNAMDIESVVENLAKNLQDIRNGSGPRLIEMETYRYRGHSMSDPGKYRSKEEVEEYRTKYDPIGVFEIKLREKKWLSDEQIEEFEAKIKKEVNEAYEFALNSPEPTADDLHLDVYSN